MGLGHFRTEKEGVSRGINAELARDGGEVLAGANGVE